VGKLKQFKTVFLFEYLGYVKNKRFQITTAVVLAAIILASFIPQIVVLVSNIGGGDKKDAGFYVGADINITADVLAEALPSYKWEQITEMPSGGFEGLITDETYSAVFYYNGGNSYDFYTTGRSMDDLYAGPSLNRIVKDAYSAELIKDFPSETKAAVEMIEGIDIEANHITVAGDFMQNYFLAYALVFVLYMSLAIGNQFIATSVVTEKTSKAMELLITSTKPEALMFGKVIGVGLAALTQLFVIAGASLLMVFINAGPWLSYQPAVMQTISQITGSPSLIISFFIFFILGFFTYAFFYAALCSTVSRIEDVNSMSTIPTMFLIAGFFTAIFGGMSNIDSIAVKVMSFIPLFAPMVMFTRQCMLAAAGWEVILAIALTTGGVILTGLCAAKIYRVGVMLYGKTPSFNEIIKMVRGS